MISAPRVTEVKLVRLAETEATSKINAMLAEGFIMLQCVGAADVMVLLRYATPVCESTQEIKLVRLGDVDAEQVINASLGEGFMPMGHVGSRSQYLLLARFVDAVVPASSRGRRVPVEIAETLEGTEPEHADALASREHDPENCPACDPRQRRDN